jgi:hypothetical protein
MPTTVKKSQSGGDLIVAPEEVSIRGSNIVVIGGQYRVGGIDVEMEEPEYRYRAMKNDTHGHSIEGHLVRSRSTGKVSVLVDEVIDDGADEPFQFKGSPYEPIANLFYAYLPAGNNDLSKANVVVYRIEGPQKEKARG